MATTIDLTSTQTLRRVHEIKRELLNGADNRTIGLLLDKLADDLTYGVAQRTGTYTSPRTCDHVGCDFTTSSRTEYWEHATRVHNF